MPLATGRIKELVGKFKTEKEGFTYYYVCIIMPPNIANFFGGLVLLLNNYCDHFHMDAWNGLDYLWSSI